MPLRQLYPEPDSKSTSRPRVDIIAIHGLNPKGKDMKAHAWDTWRKPSGPDGRLWLKEDIAKSTPESRIFLYEYNSSYIFGGERARFINKADELLEDLRIERKGDEGRPIIFLAHSLGGILAEQALVNAYNSAKYKSIYEATSGLAFFGTPHNGGNQTLVALGSAAARVATMLHLQPDSDMGEALKSGSLYTDILKEFWRERLLDFDLVSFWEGVGNIVPRESAIFGVPSDKENIVKLTADHSNLCRFDLSEKDQDNYKLVRGNIEDLYESALKKGEFITLPSSPEGNLEQRMAALRPAV
ncbi:MAG: hypothetical protein M1821_002341 [Bathelium mastoideum]|nr:MAG: hypothetical protein M1821_002341 [Bathelium mastoideum]